MASAMTTSHDGADVPVKDETSDFPPSFNQSTGDSPNLKRQRSPSSNDIGEKRQRIDTPATPMSMATEGPSIAELAAQASDAVMKQFELAASQERSHQSPTIYTTETATPSFDYKRTVPAGSDFVSDPYLYMRIFSLPILESLSTQILATLAQGPYSETIKIVTEPDSELGQAYATMKSLFDQTKRIYSKDEAFLSADVLNISEREHRATIRITNLASFSAAVFGGSMGFYQLSSSFIDIITPEGGPLEKEPGELLVNLKTQMYLAMITSEEQTDTKEDILDEMFPYDFDCVLRKRHPDTPLSGAEYEFIESVNARRKFLLEEPSDVNSIQALSERFGWETFLTGVSTYLRNNYEPLLAPFMKRHALTAPTTPRRSPDQHSAASNQVAENTYQNGSNGMELSDQDISIHAQRAADEVMKQLGLTTQTQQNGGLSQPVGSNSHNGSTYQQGFKTAVPYPTQSAPTQELYEKARRAASTKANNVGARRPGAPSQRRPWTSEEENTLMSGLDQVKGPHWSQILALYGPSGTISDILRERNQVQLKDKARNLKLFFLKSGIEVPYYLQSVTGELKTRAPSQAAKREAEERARLAGEDEQMRQEGIMALNGMAHASGSNHDSPNSMTPVDSCDSDLGQDEFQVEESDPTRLKQRGSSLYEDDHLRQSLMAANSANAGIGQQS